MEPIGLVKTIISSASFSDGRSRRRVEAVLRLYQYLGMFAALGSGLYFLSRKLGIKIDPQDQVTLAVAAVGLSVALISKLWLSLYVERERLVYETISTIGSERQFLSEWREFERTATQLVGGPESDRPISPRSLISNLVDQGYLTSSDVSTLQDVMVVRNSLVHGNEQDLPDETITRSYTELAPILARLEKSLEN